MSRDSPAAPDSICILRLSAIGDCCNTLPVVRTLQAAFPDAAITWVIGTTEYRLLEGAAGIEFITFDKADGVAAWRGIRRAMAGRRFAALLHMNASMRANFVSTAVPAYRRIGFDRTRARDYQWAFCNEHIAARHPERPHVLDGLFQFAEHLGVRERVMRWDIPVPDVDLQYARELSAGARPTCVISPCSSQRARNFRNWRVENFIILIRHLQDEYSANVLLTGAATPLERQYEQEILAATAGVTSLVGATSLKQLYAVISAADLVICPDSGPAHMATAAGTPVVGLYASSNPERTGPYLSKATTVNRYPDAVARAFGKPVEAIRFGRRVRDPDVMDLITLDDVKDKVALALGPAGNRR